MGWENELLKKRRGTARDGERENRRDRWRVRTALLLLRGWRQRGKIKAKRSGRVSGKEQPD